MKNRIFLFCLLAVMVISCAKEQQETIQTITADQDFYATIENADTRVFADDQLRVLWNADDCVSIFNKSTYNWQYRFDGVDGDNAGAFKKIPTDDFITSNPLGYVYSVYPYNENTKITNDGEIIVYLPAEQTYRENSFGLGDNTMIAIAEDNELMFKNLCGYFAVKLYGDNVSVKSITLKGNNNELLAGKATVVASIDEDPALTFDATVASKMITLTPESPVRIGSTEETATTFWFVVPPTTFNSGITLSVTDQNNGSFVKATTGSLVISRNRLKNSAALKVETGSSSGGGSDWKLPPELRLAKTSLTLTQGETHPVVVALCYSLDDGAVISYATSDSTVAKVNDKGVVTAVRAGEATITVSSSETDNYYADSATCSVTVMAAFVQPEAVDLGLSVKWASFNLGASSPEEYGDYYAWGETEPKEDYSWDTYKWCNGSENTLTKYNTRGDLGLIDNELTLDLEDDAARVNLGKGWRIPTPDEMQELCENCTREWTTENGVYGVRFTSKKEGYTDKSIFFPPAGDYRHFASGSAGYYWSSSINSVNSTRAYRLIVGADTAYWWNYIDRCNGLSIRPVCP